MIDPRVALAGFFVGTITGLTGIGGSSLLAPMLILALGVNPTVAVGTDLLYSVPTKLLATLVHLRQKTVERRLVLLLAAGGVPGALAGLVLFGALRAQLGSAELESLVRHLIGAAIVLASLMVLVMQFRRSPDAAEPPRARPAAPLAIGFVVGALVAVTSVGSGSLTLPLLLLLAPAFGVRRLIGTEIVFATVIVTVASLGHVRLGTVSWPIVASLLVGSLPGVYLGSRLCGKVGERALRGGVLVVLAYAGIRLL